MQNVSRGQLNERQGPRGAKRYSAGEPLDGGLGLPGPLFTDLYQLTMASGFWKAGKAEEEAVFQLSFRRQPFGGGFTVAAGLEDVLKFLRGFRFTEGELEWMGTLKGWDGRPLFERRFLRYLGELRLKVDVDAIPEGTVVFPHEPLLRVRGPILQGQLLESALLNFVNFQTLIATKAARVCLAAEGDPVVEFGLRRAQGVDGALTATRAAFIGGCAGTSNVLAAQKLGIPAKGTHAHSWVMAFESELAAFEAYAEAMPNNCIFLVDTFNSLEGVRHAVKVGKRMRRKGRRLVGIRLDSGDLAYLSIEARKILDGAGFKDAAIMASNDLDEHLIASMKRQGAAITIWGVGTKLVTAYDEPALGGVYKLSAIRRSEGKWEQKLKLSEQAAKATNPGILQVRRFRRNGVFAGDAIYDELLPRPGRFTIVDPADITRRKHFREQMEWEDLLVPVMRGGEPVYRCPQLETIQARTREQLRMLHAGIKRFENPHEYPAGLELQLHDLKVRLILEAKGEV